MATKMTKREMKIESAKTWLKLDAAIDILHTITISIGEADISIDVLQEAAGLIEERIVPKKMQDRCDYDEVNAYMTKWSKE